MRKAWMLIILGLMMGMTSLYAQSSAEYEQKATAIVTGAEFNQEKVNELDNIFSEWEKKFPQDKDKIGEIKLHASDRMMKSVADSLQDMTGMMKELHDVSNTMPQVSDLLNAIAIKDVNKAKELIQAGADVNENNALAGTPLTAAVQSNLYEVVDALIAAGADVNQADKHGTTPLSIAIIEQDVVIVQKLIDAHVNLETVINGLRPIELASKTKNQEIVTLLQQAGSKL